MKHICCIMGLFIAYFATAQKRGVIAMSDPDYLHSMSWNNHVQQIVDTSYLEVLYDLAYKQRPTSETALNMVVSVQIGQTCILYYSLRQRLSDDIGRKMDSLRHGTSIVPGMSIRYEMNEEEQLTHAIAGDDRINSEILMNRSDGILTERCHDYGRYDTAFGYTEQLPTFSWQTAATADSIAGYVCFQARTEYRGRKWIVWYTPEIPVAAGPWKFSGLPGLILRAEDEEGSYRWTVRNIRSARRPMIRYMTADTQWLNRWQWRKYRQSVHENPAMMLAAYYEFYLKGEALTEQSGWAIPYNPIELE